MTVNWDDVPTARHVVIIEDEPMVRMLLQESLAEIGFSSATFDNAVSGLTHLFRVQGDCCLIIADQGLPGGIEGTEFIRMVNERWPSIPSILTSGYFVEEQLIPPSTAYLHKPYTLKQLEKSIAIVMRHE
ncbi:response regulator [Pseudomonas sp. LB3P25]